MVLSYDIVSDIHADTIEYKEDCFLETMENLTGDKLIINGDFCDTDSPAGIIGRRTLDFLDKRRDKLICISGNHDPVSNILGMPMVREYRWQAGGRNFCAIHGHQFEEWSSLCEYPFVDALATRAFGFLKNCFTSWFNGSHKSLARRVARGAVQYARQQKEQDIDVVICGHVHWPQRTIFPKKRLSLGRHKKTITYINTGDWTGDICSCVTVDKFGQEKLHIIRAT